VHRFKPTSGQLIGVVGLAMAGFVVATVLVTERSLVGLRVGLLALLVAWVTWVVLLRPRVVATRETLLLRNALADWHLPLAAVEQARVGTTLHVWVGERRFVSPAIGRSTRSMVTRRGRNVVGGAVRGDPDQTGAGRADAIGDADYATFVEVQIDELARAARRDVPGPPHPVRRVWAVREIAVLVALASAVVLSMLPW
jgi:hypothetical protein